MLSRSCSCLPAVSRANLTSKWLSQIKGVTTRMVRLPKDIDFTSNDHNQEKKLTILLSNGGHHSIEEIPKLTHVFYPHYICCKVLSEERQAMRWTYEFTDRFLGKSARKAVARTRLITITVDAEKRDAGLTSCLIVSTQAFCQCMGNRLALYADAQV